jgi:hypothetical protein
VTPTSLFTDAELSLDVALGARPSGIVALAPTTAAWASTAPHSGQNRPDSSVVVVQAWQTLTLF